MNDDIRDQLAKGYEAIESAKVCFDKAKEMLDTKEAAPPRNWPERIEAGMVFRLAVDTSEFDCGTGHEYIAAIHKGGLRLTDLQTGERRSDADELFGADGDKNFTYIGHARDILTIRTDAHEPTGAELVGILEDIRNVSNNPGRTLAHLGLTECLQSCNVMARLALEKFAR